MNRYKRFLFGAGIFWSLTWGLVACGKDETVLSISTSAPPVTPTATAPVFTPTPAPTATPLKTSAAPATATPAASPVSTRPATTGPRPTNNSPSATSTTRATATSTASVALTPKVTITTKYYQVEGATADQLRAQLDKLGPLDESGQHFAAKTDGNLSWTWSYSEAGGKCTMHDISAELEVNFTFPRWAPPATAPADLVDKWNKFIAALQVHEDGHKDINIKAASEFMVKVKALPSFSTCDELKQALNKAGQDVIDKTRQENIAYDDRTQHGRTQGAVFP